MTEGTAIQIEELISTDISITQINPVLLLIIILVSTDIAIEAK